MESLHIPKRIRFQCSGCGNCCLQWPVPLTEQDVAHLQTLTAEEPRQAPKSSAIERELRRLIGKPSGPGFRSLNPGDLRFRGFSYTLEKGDDGRCRFLTPDNRCLLHEQHGAESKPSMCRLFPHAFSQTPSGVFAYVSFASSAVLFNQGMLLADQLQLLEQKYRLYRHLFPGVNPDWSRLQILDGHALNWHGYTQIEEPMLSAFDNEPAENVLDKLIKCSQVALAHLPPGADPEKLPPLTAAPAVVDQILLKHLYAAYLPDDVFAEDCFDIDAQSLMHDIVSAPHSVSFAGARLSDLTALPLGNLDESCHDLLNRFAYCRIFAKLYCGPSLGHFSVLAGIHHLFYLMAVAQLHLKRLKMQGQAIDLLAVAETVRTIERRLSQMNFSAASSAVMEVLMSSPARLVRVRRLLG